MYDYETLIQTLKNYEAFDGDILQNEDLSSKTTFKIGQKAKLFISPKNYYSFQIALTSLINLNIPFFILGGGSNVVFPDDDFNKVILCTKEFSSVTKLNVSDLPSDFGTITLQKNKVLVTCFSGTSVATLVNYCTNHNISGVEEFAGLPGSIGGAVYMNARCFNKSFSDILFYTTWMDLKSKKAELHHKLYNANEWEYKKSPFQDGTKFITTATFLLTQRTQKDHLFILENCKKYIQERVSKGHFEYPSAGSVFKNNRSFGKSSGQIIDEAGLRGYTVGGAKIADFHGNFIINTNNAKAQDVKSIVNHTKDVIKKKYDFSLESEIIFVED